MTRATEDLFWAKVHKGPSCWCWTARKARDGYGKFNMSTGRVKPKRITVLAHRFAYELTRGPIPPGMFVMHSCDNPSCVNPEHLSVGTHRANMADMVRKGRQAHTERHGRAKLTTKQVRLMRARHAAGESNASLAREFGIGTGLACMILKGQRWGHLLTGDAK